jgi:exodeoxyribonuclease V alpha subunit
MLRKVFRQAAQSDIVMNAHHILEGEPLKLDNKSRDFFFLKRDDIRVIQRVVLALVQEKMPKYVDAKIQDIQVLTPTRKGALGVESLNTILQTYLNPASPDKEEQETPRGIFRVGDKVMQIRNDYQLEWEVRGKHGITAQRGLGVFNGDMGIVKSIDHMQEILTVDYDEGKTVDYTFKQLDELELAYATTVHKAQGSEYPAVVVIVHTQHYVMLQRNLLYTAITRGRKLVLLMGVPYAVDRAIQTNTVRERRTALAEFLNPAISANSANHGEE